MSSKYQHLLIEINVNFSFYNPQFIWNEHCDSCVVVGKYNDNNEDCDSYVIVWKFNDNKRVVDFVKSQILLTIDVIRFGMCYVVCVNHNIWNIH